MEKVYVCSPLKGLDGDYDKNIKYTKDCAKKVFDRGDVPIVPHLYLPLIMNDSNEPEREKAIEMGLELLDSSNLIEVYCKYGISKGMKKEIKRAREKGKKILYYDV